MASTVADFIVGENGDLIGFPSNAIVEYPPIYPTDMASKAYVDASFPDGGDPGGSSERGFLNFSTVGTPLYGSTGADAVEYTVNRVGNMVTLNLHAFDTYTTAAGSILVASGLPKEFWPLPIGYVSDDSVATGCIHMSQIGTVPGVSYETAQIGVGSDGLIRIKTHYRFGAGGRCQWLGATFSYLNTNIAV